MIWALAALAVIAAVAGWQTRRHERQVRQWREDRHRVEAYGERIAANNARPDGDIVAVAPIRDTD